MGRVQLTCEPHGIAAQEHRLGWVPHHDNPYLGIQGVTQEGDDVEADEEDDIQDEEDVRYVVQPRPVVRQIMDQDGHDARSHVDGEPSFG